jgi:glycyl-tRNA synthetase
VEVLSEALPGWISALRFDKSMRWNQSGVNFARPIRWLLCIYGAGDDCQVVPFEYAGLCSGNLTRGLRFRQPESLAVRFPDDYLEYLRGQGIQLQVNRRREEIQRQVQLLAGETGGQVRDEPELLAEVANLVEAPAAFCGSFDRTYLKLPQEVLVSVMKKHQRYFPVVAAPAAGGQPPGELMPFFIAVRNGGGKEMPLVTEGNEHVIRARFADADYFVREDLKRPLEAYLPRLRTLTFQVQLGSMLDKCQRIVKLVGDLAPMLRLDQAELKTARRAAELCKADLATQMVVEMTSLQGLIGRFYARSSGSPEPVAQAIYEHYLPRFSGDAVPASLPGLAVGVGDRLDSLAGLFAAGLAPSGSKDPFAQRRTALGLVQNLIAWDLDFELKTAFENAAGHLPLPATTEILQTVLDFTVERLRNAMLDDGRRFDVVEAVLAAQGSNPASAAREVRALEAWIVRVDWREILPAFARCVRITRDLGETYPADRQLASEPAETNLFEALRKLYRAARDR